MKNLVLVLFCGLFLMAAFSCKKTKDPVNAQLMGTWLSSNSQDSIYFYVDNLDGTLYITSVLAKVNFAGGYVRYSESSSGGLANITSNTFDIVLDAAGPEGPTHIGGTFNPTSMVLTGNFAYYPMGDTIRSNYSYTISRP